MPTTYTITTDDPTTFLAMMNLANGSIPAPVVAALSAPASPTPAPVAAPVPIVPPAPVPASAPVAAVPPAPVPASAPVAAVPPAPVAAPAAAPVAAPAAAPVTPPAQHGAPAPGWTIQHVTGALQALAGDAGKGGPAAVKAILQKYGVTKVGDLDPAQWHNVYKDATGG